ncbi:MAG: ribonuclease HI [Pseudomonas fluorescens]|nr:MAG: ribonuclease HI [Pseudomonas fluorescens]
MTETPAPQTANNTITLVHLFTDGACSGNPGPGGWAALIRAGAHEKELSGGAPHTTNNKMELTAAIRGLQALTRPCKIVLHTDSQYVIKGITEWMPGWKRRGWKNSQNKPVENKELWEELDAATQPHKIEWKWVKGHAGHAENERVDKLAVLESMKFRK